MHVSLYSGYNPIYFACIVLLIETNMAVHELEIHWAFSGVLTGGGSDGDPDGIYLAMLPC